MEARTLQFSNGGVGGTHALSFIFINRDGKRPSMPPFLRSWIKMGWAYSEDEASPTIEPPLSEFFPEIVLRGAARINPSLKHYYGRLPRSMHHYCGYCTTTEENWPLIGEMEVDGAYIVGAMSGFGTMAACAAGELCAQRVLGNSLPKYAFKLSPERYKDAELLAEISTLSSRGIL